MLWQEPRARLSTAFHLPPSKIDHENDNLESSRAPRKRVCSQIEDRRGDLLECWTKPTTEVAEGMGRVPWREIQMAAKTAFEWGYRGKSSFDKQD